MSYRAPVKDMLFVIRTWPETSTRWPQLPGFEDAGLRHRAGGAGGMRQVQRGRGRAAELGRRQEPVVVQGRRGHHHARLQGGLPQFAEGGWQGLQHPVDFGGQGLPKTIGAACIEMLNSANMSFALCPLLTDGAIEALLTAGSDELKATYLENWSAAKWTGTMNLTEPQAGSDLAHGAHARRAAARRHLQGLRHQDLHHLR
jgi:alkylation response protein AidB-like acyl-CoA dehydrogenase